MLTGDQNLLDLAYSVRWNIRTPELYLFQLAEPDETIREVAESAMRAVVSRVSLNDAMGDRRAEIERVAENMQRILDAYRSGSRFRASPSSRPTRPMRSTTRQAGHGRTAGCPDLSTMPTPTRFSCGKGAGRGDRVRQGL